MQASAELHSEQRCTLNKCRSRWHRRCSNAPGSPGLAYVSLVEETLTSAGIAGCGSRQQSRSAEFVHVGSMRFAPRACHPAVIAAAHPILPAVKSHCSNRFCCQTYPNPVKTQLPNPLQFWQFPLPACHGAGVVHKHTSRPIFTL